MTPKSPSSFRRCQFVLLIFAILIVLLFQLYTIGLYYLPFKRLQSSYKTLKIAEYPHEDDAVDEKGFLRHYLSSSSASIHHSRRDAARKTGRNFHQPDYHHHRQHQDAIFIPNERKHVLKNDLGGTFSDRSSFHQAPSRDDETDDDSQVQDSYSSKPDDGQQSVAKGQKSSSSASSSSSSFPPSPSFNDLLLSSPEFESAKKKYTDFCAHPKNCYSTRCYAPFDYVGGGCFPSPYDSNIVDAVRKRLNLTQTVPSPPEYKTLRTHSGGYEYREFTCPDRKDQRDEYFVKNAAENAKNDPLFSFKKHTSFMFNKWYDWSGKCVNPKARKKKTSQSSKKSNNNNNNNKNDADDIDDDFTISGKHSSSDGLYRIRNVCFRPEGKMLGYAPPGRKLFQPFNGTDDVFFATHLHDTHEQNWLDDRNVDVLPKPADCYLDTTVIMMPIEDRLQNEGHAFHRFASLLRVKNLVQKVKSQERKEEEGEEEEGKKSSTTNSSSSSTTTSSTTEITIAYPIISDNIAITKEQIMTEVGFHLFYDAINTSWFSFNGFAFRATAFPDDLQLRQEQDRRVYGFIPKREDLASTNLKVCFKEVVVWQDGYAIDETKELLGMDPKRQGNTSTWNVPGRDTSFVIHGPRSDHNRETLKLVDAQMKRCGRLPPRRKRIRSLVGGDDSALRVLFVTRSTSRRLSYQPWVTDYFTKELPRRLGGAKKMVSVEFLEHTKTSFRNVAERCSDADIIIGIYGAALVWSAFLPPGAIVVEISALRGMYGELNYNHQSGINLENNGEYEASTRVNQQLHLKIFDPFVSPRFPVDVLQGYGAYVDIAAGPGGEFFDSLVIRPIHCLLKNTDFGDLLTKKEHEFDQLPVPKQCQSMVNSSLVVDTAKGIVSDSVLRGDNIARLASVKLFPTSTNHASASSSSVVRRHHHRQSRRLRLIRYFGRRVGDALAPFVFRVSNPEQNSWSPERYWKLNRQIFTQVLIVEPCAARATVWPEISALRQIIHNTGKLFVAEYALGRGICDQLVEYSSSSSSDDDDSSSNNHNNNNINNNEKKHNHNTDDLNSLLLQVAASFLLPVKGKSANEVSWNESSFTDWNKHPEEVEFIDYNDELSRWTKHGHFEVIVRDKLGIPSKDEISSLQKNLTAHHHHQKRDHDASIDNNDEHSRLVVERLGSILASISSPEVLVEKFGIPSWYDATEGYAVLTFESDIITVKNKKIQRMARRGIGEEKTADVAVVSDTSKHQMNGNNDDGIFVIKPRTVTASVWKHSNKG